MQNYDDIVALENLNFCRSPADENKNWWWQCCSTEERLNFHCSFYGFEKVSFTRNKTTNWQCDKYNYNKNVKRAGCYVKSYEKQQQTTDLFSKNNYFNYFNKVTIIRLGR